MPKLTDRPKKALNGDSNRRSYEMAKSLKQRIIELEDQIEQYERKIAEKEQEAVSFIRTSGPALAAGVIIGVVLSVAVGHIV